MRQKNVFGQNKKRDEKDGIKNHTIGRLSQSEEDREFNASSQLLAGSWRLIFYFQPKSN